MTDESSSDLILRKRYRIAAAQTVPIAIQRFGNGQKPASGELVDISVTGARIFSDTPLQFGEKLVLHLESKPIGLSVSIGCHVQWIRGGSSEDKWTVGCLFEYHLEKQVLEEYVDDGLLERRQSDRYTISLPASVRFEGVADEETDVDVYNIGSGGFCFHSPTAGRIGSRVRMTLDDAADGEVEGRIMWQFADDGQFLIGCQWANRKGVAFAKQLLQATVRKPGRTRIRIGDHLVGALVIAVVAFALGVLVTTVKSSLAKETTSNLNASSVME
jgi:PilZ domain